MDVLVFQSHSKIQSQTIRNFPAILKEDGKNISVRLSLCMSVSVSEKAKWLVNLSIISSSVKIFSERERALELHSGFKGMTSQKMSDIKPSLPSHPSFRISIPTTTM